MTATKPTMNERNTLRRYDLDWLRFLAILILLFFHSGMLFNTLGWHIKNNETSNTFNHWMIWLHYWRMPLLLFISGAGTYMALGKRSVKQFVGERFRRLFIPLLFGMFIIVPPQIYFEYIDRYNSFGEFYKTVFEFKPYPPGSLSWHHLWFVLYLLIYSLISIPLLKFLRSKSSDKLKAKALAITSSTFGLIVVPACILLFSQLILRPYYPKETHSLVNDWAYFTFYLIFFLLGMLCYSNQEIWNALGLKRKSLLVGMVLTLIPFYVIYFNFYGWYELPASASVIQFTFDATAIFLAWSTVLTVIAYGQHHLNKFHPWLTHINNGIYPFYILHQTAIIVIGYYVCQLEWSIPSKYWTVSMTTLVTCIAFYLIVIRPFDAMRFLFGVKPKENKYPTLQQLSRDKIK